MTVTRITIQVQQATITRIQVKHAKGPMLIDAFTKHTNKQTSKPTDKIFSVQQTNKHQTMHAYIGEKA